MKTKVSTICKESKILSKFYKDISRNDRYSHRCKQCNKIINKIYNINNKDKTSEINKKWW